MYGEWIQCCWINKITDIDNFHHILQIFEKLLSQKQGWNPLSPARAKIVEQGFSPTLLTITRQPIELESCEKPQKIRLD